MVIAGLWDADDFGGEVTVDNVARLDPPCPICVATAGGTDDQQETPLDTDPAGDVVIGAVATACGCCWVPPCPSCNDGNECTRDYCEVGCTTAWCGHNWRECNDGLPCTADFCNQTTGGCEFPWRNCDDGNVCTYDRCDLDDGSCEHLPRCDVRVCCPAGSSYFCCNTGESVCCPRNPAYADHCCRSDETCCAGGCCDADQTCCNGSCGSRGACCFFDTGSCSEKTWVCCAQEGGTYQGDGTRCTPADLCGPKCQNCQNISETLYECHHWADSPAGYPCSTVECITNVLDTATCDHYPWRLGAPICGNRTVTGGMVVQTIHASDCPGTTLVWTPWHTISFDDCASTCGKQGFDVGCTTSGCPGPIVRGPYNRGQKKACGCP